MKNVTLTPKHITMPTSNCYAAETLLSVALFELNKEKTSDEGYTHGEMVRGLFHTRCQIRVKHHKGIKRIYLDCDTEVQQFARLIELFWPDNARIHHAELIQPFLEKHKALLQFVYLPPYSPNFYLIEELWGWMKSSVINNVFFDSAQKIRKAVQGFIIEINKTPEATVDRLCIQL